MTPEFMAGECDRVCRLRCCDCGGLAEGNVSCDDGDLCDACHDGDVETFEDILADDSSYRWDYPEDSGDWDSGDCDCGYDCGG